VQNASADRLVRLEPESSAHRFTLAEIAAELPGFWGDGLNSDPIAVILL